MFHKTRAISNTYVMLVRFVVPKNNIYSILNQKNKLKK